MLRSKLLITTILIVNIFICILFNNIRVLVIIFLAFNYTLFLRINSYLMSYKTLTIGHPGLACFSLVAALVTNWLRVTSYPRKWVHGTGIPSMNCVPTAVPVFWRCCNTSGDIRIPPKHCIVGSNVVLLLIDQPLSTVTLIRYRVSTVIKMLNIIFKHDNCRVVYHNYRIY